MLVGPSDASITPGSAVRQPKRHVPSHVSIKYEIVWCHRVTCHLAMWAASQSKWMRVQSFATCRIPNGDSRFFSLHFRKTCAGSIMANAKGRCFDVGRPIAPSRWKKATKKINGLVDTIGLFQPRCRGVCKMPS